MVKKRRDGPSRVQRETNLAQLEKRAGIKYQIRTTNSSADDDVTSNSQADLPGNKFWLVAAAAISTVGLIVALVVFAFPSMWDNSASQNRQPRAQNQIPESAVQTRTKSSSVESPIALAADAAVPVPRNLAVAPKLPETPLSFEVKDEQALLLETLESAIKRFPQDPEILRIAALTYSELLLTEPAIERYAQALPHTMDKAEVLGPLAKLLLQLGRQSEVIEYLSPELDSSSLTPEILASLGRAHQELGQGEQAVTVLSAAKKSFPNSPEIAITLAQAYLLVEDFSTAEQEARRAIALGQQERESYIALSNALLRQGKREEAIEIRRDLPPAESKLLVDDAMYKDSFRQFATHSYSLLATQLSKKNLESEAEQQLLHALSLEPESVKVLVSLADLYYRQQKLPAALAVRERLTQVEPNEPLHFQNIASIAIAMGKTATADQALTQAAEIDDSGNADLLLTQLCLGLGNYQKAVAAAERSVEQLRTADSHLALITSLNLNGDNAKAVAALLKAKELFPNDPRILNLRLQ